MRGKGALTTNLLYGPHSDVLRSRRDGNDRTVRIKSLAQPLLTKSLPRCLEAVGVRDVCAAACDCIIWDEKFGLDGLGPRCQHHAKFYIGEEAPSNGVLTASRMLDAACSNGAQVIGLCSECDGEASLLLWQQDSGIPAGYHCGRCVREHYGVPAGSVWPQVELRLADEAVAEAKSSLSR